MSLTIPTHCNGCSKDEFTVGIWEDPAEAYPKTTTFHLTCIHCKHSTGYNLNTLPYFPDEIAKGVKEYFRVVVFNR